MERVVRGRSFTLSQTFYSDGTPIAPTGSPTVAIVRADGTTVTTSSVSGTGTGPYTVTVTAANNTLLDTLTVTWTATIGGQPNTYVDTVEVAGDFLFTVAEVRAIRGLEDTTDYPTSVILAMRTTVEDAIEEYTGALVPRYSFETVSAVRCEPIRLRKPFARAIRSVKVAGTALTVDQIAALSVNAGFVNGYGWSTGFNNVTVGYEHGLDQPPQRLRRAALLLAKVWLLAGPVDDRTNTFTSTDGGTYSLVTPGRGGSLFGVPEVDAAVMDHKIPVIA